MPLKKKLKKVDEEELDEELVEESGSDHDQEDFDDSDDDDDSGDSDDYENDEDDEILVDFEARSLRPTDSEPIKLMIQQKLGPFSSLNIHELSKIVVNQENIGNAIYQVISEEDEDDDEPQKSKSSKESKETKNDDDEDDTIFGILSIIDLSSVKNKAFTSSFKTFLLKNYETDLKHRPGADRMKPDKLAQLLDTNQVAYVINERYVNIPPAISVPMFESLMLDLDKLSADHDIKKASYWLFLSKYFVQDASNEAKSSNHSTSTTIYSNPEEEVFEELSEHKFEISYAGKLSNATNGKWSDSDAILQPNLKGFFVPSNKIREAIEKVKELLK